MTDGEKCERDLFFLFLSVATPLLSAKAPVEGAGFGDLELFLEKKISANNYLRAKIKSKQQRSKIPLQPKTQ